MDTVHFLIDQFKLSRGKIFELLNEVPHDVWFKNAGAPNSNVAWQVGHLVLASNYHCISLVLGINEAMIQKDSFKIYMKYCIGLGSINRSLPEGFISVEDLISDLKEVHDISITGLRNLQDSDLNRPLEPTKMKHPFAKTKYEALSWAFKHDIWHCAEIENLKMNLGIGHKWM